MLAVLVTIIVQEPFTREDLTWAIFLGAMAVAALLLDGHRRWTRVAVALVGFPVGLQVVGALWFSGFRWWKAFTTGPFSILIQLLLIVALFYCSYLILRSLLLARRITPNEILGTISLYLMIGLTWAIVYGMLEHMVPGSFGPASPLFSEQRTPPFVYFSFVTQAGLGDGDITPQLPLASRLVILQSVMGQFYVGVVVAYLISILIVHRVSE
jgi:voltage-gated potassium channel